MFDKAALFTELTHRNALRRAAGLPLLNLRAELEHAASLAAWQDAKDRHADDLVRLHGEVLAEFQREHGPDFDETHSAGARWMIELTVQQRFVTFLKSLGFKQPCSRNSVTYGQHNAA